MEAGEMNRSIKVNRGGWAVILVRLGKEPPHETQTVKARILGDFAVHPALRAGGGRKPGWSVSVVACGARFSAWFAKCQNAQLFASRLRRLTEKHSIELWSDDPKDAIAALTPFSHIIKNDAKECGGVYD
jgi:hypothetical protein